MSISTTLRRQVHSGQTVLEAVQEIREHLSRRSSVPAASNVSALARNDAKVLVANALQPRLAFSNDVFFHEERKLTEQEAARLNASVEQRAKGKPLAYVIGRKEFWSMDFAVTKDTLIPRSDSEVLIETLTQQFRPQTSLDILDIGTGTGCLLLSTLSKFPYATGVGIDISPGALDAAKANARAHRLDGRTEFMLRDLQTLPELQQDDIAMYQRFDVILCNPPYIPRRELHLVGPDVLEYEPHLALFSDGGFTQEGAEADPDGLRMYQLLYKSVGNLFKKRSTGSEWSSPREKMMKDVTTKACLLMEIGSETQARAVQALFSDKAATRSPRCATNKRSALKFEQFLFDASGKYRGLCYIQDSKE